MSLERQEQAWKFPEYEGRQANAEAVAGQLRSITGDPWEGGQKRGFRFYGGEGSCLHVSGEVHLDSTVDLNADNLSAEMAEKFLRLLLGGGCECMKG